MVFRHLNRLFQSLAETRRSVSGILSRVSPGGLSRDSVEDMEALLLSSDMGIQTTEEIVDWLEARAGGRIIRKDLGDYLLSMLRSEKNSVGGGRGKPEAILIVGVNGTGKTTTAAKLAHYFKARNRTVLLIGADTYRAAAVEQLKSWCTLAEVDMVFNESAKDPSSVIFDGLTAARARKIRYAIIDTAGRLHTYKNLMNEVGKMHRVVETKFTDFDVLTYLTLDANLGQNSLTQAKEFDAHTPIDGIIVTKMDGTAKGGIVFPIYRELGIPVKFLGVGETLDDLIEFDAKEYVSSLLGTDEPENNSDSIS